MRLYLFILLAILGCQRSEASAKDITCPAVPEPMNEIHRDVKGDVDVAIGKIGVVKSGDLTAKVDVVTKDLVGKYPNAERLYVANMLAATSCSMIKNADSLSDEAKLKKWTDFSQDYLRLHVAAGATKRPGK